MPRNLISEEQRRQLSLRIFHFGGIQFDDQNGFTFNLHKDHPEAPKSPNYVNLRDIFRDVEFRQDIADLLLPVVQEIAPDGLIDLPESVTPLVTRLSDLTGIKVISLRSEALKGGQKDHGTKGIINGKYKEGDVGLLIDDVVSSFAHTKFRAIPLLQGAGIKLAPQIVVVMDREEGGREMLERQGFRLRSLLGLHTDVTRHCLEAGVASERIREMSMEFASAARSYALGQAA